MAGLDARHRLIAAVAALALAVVGSVSCTSGNDDPSPDRQGPLGTDWSPLPRVVGDLTVLAEVDGEDLLLHTGSGDRVFLPGITVGNSIPAGRPGDLTDMDVADYLAWFAKMNELGIRVVRTYSLQPSAFYDALGRHAASYPTRPLYLVQGVGLPEEALAAPASILSSTAVTEAFAEDLRQASAAVHGDLADASYRTDVSPWLAGWIVGNELDPGLVQRTDAVGATFGAGTFVTAADGASPTEQWLAHQLDVLAEAEFDRGTSAPLAFVSWPTTDPLQHPAEPVAAVDRVGVDPQHVVATEAWPSGTFAAMHAYPFYPDFLRHEADLAMTTWEGEPDPFAGYLTALRDHLTMPLVIAETGVPASIGSAHRGPRERHQGPHSEQEAMMIQADLLRIAHATGTAGAFITSWTDEWWRGAWNSSVGQDPATRHRWHDPLTVTQWTGVLRYDAPFIPRSVSRTRGTGTLARVALQASASFLHVRIGPRHGAPGRTRITIDSLPGGGPEHVVVADPPRGKARVLVRADLDPLRHYTRAPLRDLVEAGRWHLVRQLTNDQQVVDDVTVPPETSAIGDLVRGSWRPGQGDYDSRATWRVVDSDSSLRLRIPWSMLGFADPSRRLVLTARTPPKVVAVEGLGVNVASRGDRVRLHYSWPTWTMVETTARLSAGSEVLAAAYLDVVS